MEVIWSTVSCGMPSRMVSMLVASSAFGSARALASSFDTFLSNPMATSACNVCSYIFRISSDANSGSTSPSASGTAASWLPFFFFFSGLEGGSDSSTCFFSFFFFFLASTEAFPAPPFSTSAAEAPGFDPSSDAGAGRRRSIFFFFPFFFGSGPPKRSTFCSACFFFFPTIFTFAKPPANWTVSTASLGSIPPSSLARITDAPTRQSRSIPRTMASSAPPFL
mmetsp:Transcript_4428/g.10836  ORF Transcript_4428/g.10836 Transcript_4428/m.10836 type:complete len:222 (-) Transcript_4428:756-1421(-)